LFKNFIPERRYFGLFTTPGIHVCSVCYVIIMIAFYSACNARIPSAVLATAIPSHISPAWNWRRALSCQRMLAFLLRFIVSQKLTATGILGPTGTAWYSLHLRGTFPHCYWRIGAIEMKPRSDLRWRCVSDGVALVRQNGARRHSTFPARGTSNCLYLNVSVQGRHHVFKVGGPIPWSNTDGIPSFMDCSLLRNGITLFIKKVGVVRPNMGGSGPPPWPPVVAPLFLCYGKTPGVL